MGLPPLTGVHEALKAQMVAMKGTVTALAETNVNWTNFQTQRQLGSITSTKAMLLCIFHTLPVMRANSISYSVVGQV